VIIVILIFSVPALLIWIAVVISAIAAKIKCNSENLPHKDYKKVEGMNNREDEIESTQVSMGRLAALRKITLRAAILLGLLTTLLIPLGLIHGSFSDGTLGQIILFAASIFGLTALYLIGLRVMLAVKLKTR